MQPLPYDAEIRDGIVYDPAGNKLGAVTDFDITTIAGPATSRMTPGDIKRQNEANAKELGTQAVIGGLADLAQWGLGAIETDTDKRNKAEIQRLEKEPGLSADEAAYLDATMLDPARALARESRERAEQRLSRMDNTSLAAQKAVQAAADENAREAALAAGREKARADIEARAANRRELEQRYQYEANKEKANIDRASQMLGSLAQMGGRIAAAQVGKREPKDADLLAMSKETKADGAPAYPDLWGKGPDEIRAKIDAQEKERKAAKRKRSPLDPLTGAGDQFDATDPTLAGAGV